MLPLLILAAGESSRMRFPKALLKISGETFIECMIRKATMCGIHSILVVTGADHEKIVPHMPESVVCVKNEDSMRGQISSVQKGIAALDASSTAVMVWPVDQPLVLPQTLNRIMDAHQRAQRALTIPVYQKSKGHPVIYNDRAMKSVLELRSHQTGKDLQKIFSADLTLVEVDDPGVVIDIDTPEDYEKFIKPLL